MVHIFHFFIFPPDKLKTRLPASLQPGCLASFEPRGLAPPSGDEFGII
jgi:hypothetical protein